MGTYFCKPGTSADPCNYQFLHIEPKAVIELDRCDELTIPQELVHLLEIRSVDSEFEKRLNEFLRLELIRVDCCHSVQFSRASIDFCVSRLKEALESIQSTNLLPKFSDYVTCKSRNTLWFSLVTKSKSVTAAYVGYNLFVGTVNSNTSADADDSVDIDWRVISFSFLSKL